MSNEWSIKNSSAFQTKQGQSWTVEPEEDWQSKAGSLTAISIRYEYGFGDYGCGFYGIGQGCPETSLLPLTWQELQEQQDLTEKTRITWQQLSDGTVLTTKVRLGWQRRRTDVATEQSIGWGQGGWGDNGWGGIVITIDVDITRWFEGNRGTFVSSPNTKTHQERVC